VVIHTPATTQFSNKRLSYGARDLEIVANNKIPTYRSTQSRVYLDGGKGDYVWHEAAEYGEQKAKHHSHHTLEPCHKQGGIQLKTKKKDR
jgi:hypothetical protein